MKTINLDEREIESGFPTVAITKTTLSNITAMRKASVMASECSSAGIVPITKIARVSSGRIAQTENTTLRRKLKAKRNSRNHDTTGGRKKRTRPLSG